MSDNPAIPLVDSARQIGCHPAALRKTLNQFSIVERSGRNRVVDPDIVRLFKQMKRATGYLYPRNVKTRNDLVATARKYRDLPDLPALAEAS